MTDEDRERIAAAIEAKIVTDPADRYQLWPCLCLNGEKCYPHLAAEAMNRVTTQDGYDEQWPVIQAGMFWDELEPVILRAAASIVRG